jgi:RNA polymerase sigma-70 factor (ECF subfamily)
MSEGKKALIERLFSEQGAALQAFFRRRIRAAPDAPDLAQEVYVRMLRVSDTDAIRNPEGYLYTIASNLVKEHRIVEQHRAACDDVESFAVQEQLAESPRFDGEVDIDRRLLRLQEVFTKLSPNCRAAVILHYQQGLSYREIAHRMDVSTHMVKKYLAQAIKGCRRRMEHLR